MATIFRCPDCYALHEEPLNATYVLSVRCADCEFELELSVWQAIVDRSLPHAA